MGRSAGKSSETVLWLAAFRQQVEREGETPCHQISTTVGIALADVCQALGLTDDQTRIVIGDLAYRAIADQAIPFTLIQEVERVQPTAVA